jgi:hypothetical protein
MANYSITPCSGSTSIIVDFGVTAPIVSKVYYLYFTGATNAGCYTVNSGSVGVAVDGVSNISDPNNDCFTCTGCTCHYVNVTIVQNEINAAQQAITDQRNALVDPIMLRLQALGQTPYGQTTTGSSFGLQGQPYQPTSSSPLAGLLGAGLTGLRAASGLGWQPLGR